MNSAQILQYVRPRPMALSDKIERITSYHYMDSSHDEWKASHTKTRMRQEAMSRWPAWELGLFVLAFMAVCLTIAWVMVEGF